MACHRVNWSSTQIPDWREPLPTLAVAAERQVGLGPATSSCSRDSMPAETRSPEPERVQRVASCRSRRQPVPVPVGQVIASSKSSNHATPTIGPNVSVAVQRRRPP